MLHRSFHKFISVPNAAPIITELRMLIHPFFHPQHVAELEVFYRKLVDEVVATPGAHLLVLTEGFYEVDDPLRPSS